MARMVLAVACGSVASGPGCSVAAPDVDTAEDASTEAYQDSGSTDAPAGTDAAVPEPHACSDLFDPAQLRTYEVMISESEWQKMMQEFLEHVPSPDGSGFVHPYHPIVFKMGSETRTDAAIRLKGDSSWLDTVQFDANPKAQFVIAFDQVNRSAAFHGVDKLELDMPRTDETYLRERLGNSLMRELGLPAVCAASARLVINGAYYGLYATTEKMGRKVLKRIFPEAPDGALWKSGVILENSTATSFELAHQAAWVEAEDVVSSLKIVNLEQAIGEWAAEIVLNDADGYYGGDHNFYTYDHPDLGFLWLPSDLDSCFNYMPSTMHPIYWWEDQEAEQLAGQHYRAVINDPIWRAKLVEAVASILSRWDVQQVQATIDAWRQQVAVAIEQDPHRWATMEQVALVTEDMRNSAAERPRVLESWIGCERTGAGADVDGDGAPWCKDCNDKIASVHPGATEVCGNAADDDCDGLKDESCP